MGLLPSSVFLFLCSLIAIETHRYDIRKIVDIHSELSYMLKKDRRLASQRPDRYPLHHGLHLQSQGEGCVWRTLRKLRSSFQSAYHIYVVIFIFTCIYSSSSDNIPRLPSSHHWMLCFGFTSILKRDAPSYARLLSTKERIGSLLPWKVSLAFNRLRLLLCEFVVHTLRF